jgi:hypothetical protein
MCLSRFSFLVILEPFLGDFWSDFEAFSLWDLVGMHA